MTAVASTHTTHLTGEAAAIAADLEHLVECHNDDRTLCGLHAADMPWNDAETTCVVCLAMEDVPCGCPPTCSCKETTCD